MRDEELLERLQRGAFGYFLETTDPKSGLVADTSREGAPVSIAVVGFALASYVVAVERGWLERDDAAERALAALRFFASSAQDSSADASGYKGFYYHFLSFADGRRAWECELSPIDTALLLAGVLTAGAYFVRDTAAETELRALARELWARVDWDWARNGRATLAQGWKPECGFLHYGWDGYNEAALLYLLGLASPSRPLSPESYAAWTATYQWESIYGSELLYAGPLFIHLFSHAWVDFRKIRDPFMQEKKSDYFENTRRAVEVQREHARLNPGEHEGYSRDCWGFSAGDGPGFRTLTVRGRRRRFFEYVARGAPFGPDDGTIAAATVLGALPFAPRPVLDTVRRFLELYPEWTSTWRLPSGFNRTAPAADPRGWISEGHYGLDQGLVVLMLENYRSGLIWKLTRRMESFRLGLRRAGFKGGWL